MDTISIPISPVDWNIKLPDFTKYVTGNNIPIYTVQTEAYDIAYVELVFENGRLSERKKLASRCCSNQLLEGSYSKSRFEIAEFFDFYGSSYHVHSDLDFTVIAINTMHKHFEKVFTFLIDVIISPLFESEKLNKGKRLLLSQLQHQLSEPDFVSYRELTAHLYGGDTIYGYNSTPERIEGILPEDLKQYFDENYTSDKLKIFYCGKNVKNDFWEEQTLKIKSTVKIQNEYPTINTITIQKHFPIEGCQQRSLKMGLRLFKKTDPDYYPMYFINTLLGDYFGSRLMNQIREKHGLTYDIHSTLDVQLHDGIFYISAELNPNQTEKTIQLIKKEIQKLRSKEIEKEELNMVKNYLNGHLLRLIDGPYQTIQLLKILITEFQDDQSFDVLVHEVQSIHQETIHKISSKYLKEEEMSIITAGS